LAFLYEGHGDVKRILLMTATDMRETLKWKCKVLLLPSGGGAETFSFLDELFCTRENPNIIIIIIII
jgi:hypothetical protein